MNLTKRLELLYVLNFALLFTHEIDSAYWQEWMLFGIPGGIQVFVAVNFMLLVVALYGHKQLILERRAGTWFSLLLALGGMIAFSVHSFFIVTGHSLPHAILIQGFRGYPTPREYYSTTTMPFTPLTMMVLARVPCFKTQEGASSRSVRLTGVMFHIAHLTVLVSQRYSCTTLLMIRRSKSQVVGRWSSGQLGRPIQGSLPFLQGIPAIHQRLLFAWT